MLGTGSPYRLIFATLQRCWVRCRYQFSSRSKQYPRALYVPSTSGQYPPVYPRLGHIDAVCKDIDRWKHILTVRKEISEENIYSHINLERICQQWNDIKALNKSIYCLKQREQQIRQQLWAEHNNETVCEKKLELYKQELAEIVKETKELESEWKVVEKKLAGVMLDIPNSIDTDTPSESKVIYESEEDDQDYSASDGALSHANICKQHGVLHPATTTPQIPLCYKTGMLAEVEYAVECSLYDKMRSMSFIPISPPHLYNSPILEAAHMCTDESDSGGIWSIEKTIAELSESYSSAFHSHVCGVSVASFLTLFCRRLLRDRALPVQYMSCGSTYVGAGTASGGSTAVGPGAASCDSTSSPDLYSCRESKVCDMFIASTGAEPASDTRQRMLDVCHSVYREFGVRYRVTQLAGHELPAECDWCCLLQLYSPHAAAYVPAGHLASHDTYLSDRLCMMYVDGGTGRRLPLRTHYCRLVNINTLLAVLIEHWQHVTPPQHHPLLRHINNGMLL